MSGIQMALLGASADATITITDQTISGYVFPPSTAEVVYQLTSAGKVNKIVNGVTTELEQWCTPVTSAANYEAYVTVNSGGLTSGTTGSWVALSSTRSWTLQEVGSGNTAVCNFTVQIRRVATTVVLDSATIDLTAGVF